MKITILDHNTITRGDLSLAPIEALGDVRIFDALPQSEVARAIGDSDAVVVNKARITAEIMDACPHLRFIGLFATGYNNIDTTAAKARGIVVCNVPGYSTDSVAQHVFAMILHFASYADDYAASVASGTWVSAKTFSYFAYPTSELRDKTLGILGLGTIGRAVAGIARAFGMRVIATAHRPTVCEGVETVPLDTLLTESDYLTLHCPLTEETRHLIDRAALAKMKPDAVLINTARGAVVDEEALVHALNTGKLRGAGIDVLDEEPMRAGHPYLTAKNCYVTPHVAWATIEARTRLVGIVADNLRAFEAGAPIHVVNP
ncbi:MAG: D-2-hydroxyacid dehydrogenase [Clostridia bacterium]|nr:D-2-hydroxyacid dehydrogenase [Clostridia bacterium]